MSRFGEWTAIEVIKPSINLTINCQQILKIKDVQLKSDGAVVSFCPSFDHRQPWEEDVHKQFDEILFAVIHLMSEGL